jgi:hypothetical protein
MTHPLEPYITRNEPFGPIDSTDIDPGETVALEKLFEQHNRTYRNLHRRPSIIMGRKGSGKTSYLRTVYFESKYDFHVEIRTDHALTHISKAIQNTIKDAVFPEMLAEVWEIILWLCVLYELRRRDFLPPDAAKQADAYFEQIGVQHAVNVEDIFWKLADLFDQMSKAGQRVGLSEVLRRLDHAAFKSIAAAAEESLRRANKKFVILMDSLDDFQLDFDSVAYAIQGLLKCVGSMNKPRDVVDIRFCLPAELYRRIVKISSNPNKDFRRSLKLQWTASELLLIGAQRLKIFLELYYPDDLNQLLPLDLTSKTDALKLFGAVLPKHVTNQAGYREETIAYILRHTQLLPRHLLILLNSIFKNLNHEQMPNPFPISEARILNGIRQEEARIVQEIFVAFKLIHPTAEAVCKRCVPELRHKFSVGELHRVYTRKGKGVFDGDTQFEFRRMLLEIGALGKVKLGKATDMYIRGNFEYTVEHELGIGDDDELCVHPLFSGMYGNDTRERPVYPYGCELNDEDYRDNFE